MRSDVLTRRLFLQGSSTLVGSTMMRAGVPAFAALSQAACTAKEEAAAFENITNAEAREIIAIAARILPTTDTPGATEAGAVYFFDRAFGSMFADIAGPARGMLAQFQAGVAGRFPGAEIFSDLDEADQDAYLASVENTPFFQGARFMTIAGVFGMSIGVFVDGGLLAEAAAIEEGVDELAEDLHPIARRIRMPCHVFPLFSIWLRSIRGSP